MNTGFSRFLLIWLILSDKEVTEAFVTDVLVGLLKACYKICHGWDVSSVNEMWAEGMPVYALIIHRIRYPQRRTILPPTKWRNHFKLPAHCNRVRRLKTVMTLAHKVFDHQHLSSIWPAHDMLLLPDDIMDVPFLQIEVLKVSRELFGPVKRC